MKPTTSSGKSLDELRVEIENADRDILKLIQKRIMIAEAIGHRKLARGKPTLVPEREAAVVRKAAELANEMGLPEEEIRKLMWILIGLSRKHQQG